ncbi:MAG: amidohydrolase family protein [Planctomycetota bacterium]
MGIVLTNALLVDIDPLRVDACELRIDGGRIVARNARIATEPGDEIVNCGGGVILPGLVNGHTHLYSALAVGMPAPANTPRNFLEILKFVWWRLDQALDVESIVVSARIGAIQALRCGTTTFIDHHASPNCISGSLDLIERGISEVGLRGVMCYETTDRHGRLGRKAGLDENRRYLDKCRNSRDGRFAAMVGAHASFTLEDDSLDALTDMAVSFDTGVHIHVAEDPCDDEDARSRRQPNDAHAVSSHALIDRLERHGLLRSKSILAHGTHLTSESVARLNEAGVTLAHNARSNMNNAVGYAPMAAFCCPVMLGTDGIGGDMFAEAKAAWMISRHQKAGLTPVDIVAMLANSARRASQALGVTLGKLEVGAAADVVITDYVSFTPLTTENLTGHLLFGLFSNHVRSVIVNGVWRLRDGWLVDLDLAAECNSAVQAARSLWQRMSALPL